MDSETNELRCTECGEFMKRYEVAFYGDTCAECRYFDEDIESEEAFD
jgi:hypothetical protein